MKPCFVFVVCGHANLIRELHVALAALRRHSRADILVVTDSRRNEIPIVWADVIDVATASILDHHQASISLKTRVHRLVPPGRRYCYLDSDVFATGAEVDGVFTSMNTPVAFASDLIRLHQFSPHAVRCGCAEANAAERKELAAMLTEAYPLSYAAAQAGPKSGWTPADFEANAARVLVRWRAYLAHRLTPASASQQGDSDAARWRSYWYESHSLTLREPEHVAAFVERTTAWRRDRRRQSWISPAGNDVFDMSCGHLVAAIRESFGITVNRSRWQHWNGGVFLFDERGHAFLDAWHEKTMRIFGLPAWRTRDQGTLVATVWEHGLEHQRLIPSRFNCILDPSVGATMASQAGDALTTDAFLTTVRPVLAHVLRASGDSAWPVWAWVHARATGSPIPPNDGTSPPR